MSARTCTGPPQRGFTLTELVVTICILAILAALALPSLSTALTNQRLRAAGTDLMSSLLLARSEAIKRRAIVQVAPLTGGDWSSGWRVTDTNTGEQIDRKDALGYRVAVSLAPSAIDYGRNGRLTTAGATRLQFSDQDLGSTGMTRCVTIDPSGLPRVQLAACT
jgi:type IV fimbrial biogenesis protein FimT